MDFGVSPLRVEMEKSPLGEGRRHVSSSSSGPQQKWIL